MVSSTKLSRMFLFNLFRVKIVGRRWGIVADEVYLYHICLWEFDLCAPSRCCSSKPKGSPLDTLGVNEEAHNNYIHGCPSKNVWRGNLCKQTSVLPPCSVVTMQQSVLIKNHILPTISPSPCLQCQLVPIIACLPVRIQLFSGASVRILPTRKRTWKIVCRTAIFNVCPHVLGLICFEMPDICRGMKTFICVLSLSELGDLSQNHGKRSRLAARSLQSKRHVRIASRCSRGQSEQ